MTFASAIHQPALIVTRSGRQWWVCPECNKTIAEVKRESIVIEMRNRRLVVSGMAYSQVCPHCHATSEYRQAA